MRYVLALLPLVCGCVVAHEEPAVRGLPRDDRAAPLSAVWVGHATVLLRFGSRTVLTDPNLSGAILVLPRETQASLRPSELPRIDVAVISHMHFALRTGERIALGDGAPRIFGEEGAAVAER